MENALLRQLDEDSIRYAFSYNNIISDHIRIDFLLKFSLTILFHYAAFSTMHFFRNDVNEKQ